MNRKGVFIALTVFGLACWMSAIYGQQPTRTISATKPSTKPASQSAKVYTKWPFDSKEAGRRQDETAKALGVSKELALELGGKVILKLVLIPAGRFTMGSPKGEKGRREDEGPQHEVTISTPFYMGVFSVAQAQWEEVMGTTVAQQAGMVDKSGKLFGEGPEIPMYLVSWEDATEFCKKVSAKAGMTVKLPSEAQWEYACRAGSDTRHYYGDINNDTKLGAYGWYLENGHFKSLPVGQKHPNGWGLYDMNGVLWQWCQDWYSEKYYSERGNHLDPKGPVLDTGNRALRGGSSFRPINDTRSASRAMDLPKNRSKYYGFRIVVEINQKD